MSTRSLVSTSRTRQPAAIGCVVWTVQRSSKRSKLLSITAPTGESDATANIDAMAARPSRREASTVGTGRTDMSASLTVSFATRGSSNPRASGRDSDDLLLALPPRLANEDPDQPETSGNHDHERIEEEVEASVAISTWHRLTFRLGRAPVCRFCRVGCVNSDSYAGGRRPEAQAGAELESNSMLWRRTKRTMASTMSARMNTTSPGYSSSVMLPVNRPKSHRPCRRRSCRSPATSGREVAPDWSP